MNGRPLRFLAGLTVGWVALRTVMMWPNGVPVAPPAAPPPTPPPARIARPAPPLFVAAETALPMPSFLVPPALARASPVIFARFATPPFARERHRPDPTRVALAMISLLSPGRPWSDAPPPPQTMPLPGARPNAPVRSRWSASAWLLLRDGGSPAPGLGDGQLGGGQGGLRIAYAVTRRMAVFGRVTSPLSGPGREAAIGIDWRPTRWPIRLIAERRFALDGGKGGPGLAIVGGTGPARIAGGFDLETYGQAGIVRRARTEPYADGSARFTRPLATIGKARVDLGLGAWGGAQRGAARLDIGPTLGLRAPVAGKTIRLSLDWRRRIAGGARPGSGPALSIGSDF